MWAVIAAAVCGHGMMLNPLSRNALEGIFTKGGSMWFSQGCTIGCSKCNTTGTPVPAGFPGVKGPPSTNIGSLGGDLCPNDHSKSKVPTVTATNLVSMPRENRKSNWSRWHPWASPGSTPGLDPCGMAGGAPTNMSMRAGGFGPETGYPQGFRGSMLPPIPRGRRSIWRSGDTAEVSWVAVANHAGGYSYSLCPAGSPLTEECFDKMPLQFANFTHQNLRYMYMTSASTISPNRTEFTIEAARTSEGVYPKGSTWTKNPVPIGSDVSGEWQWNEYPAQFSPPPGCDSSCWGYQPCNVGFTHPSYEGWNNTKAAYPACANNKAGEGCCHTTAYMEIIDEVVVPKIPAGEYVVRWRWDAEQSPQIWSGCGDIIIE